MVAFLGERTMLMQVSTPAALPPSRLLDTGAAADYLGIKGHTLEIWRMTRRYPLPFVRIGRRVKYRQADLDAFISARTCGAFSDEPEAA